MIIEAAKFALDVFGLGLLEELAVALWEVLAAIGSIPAAVMAVLSFAVGG